MIAPMKFEHSDPDHMIEFIEDDNWVMEQKLDGSRAIVRIGSSSIDFFTHGGRLLKHTAATQHFDRIREDLKILQSSEKEIWLDGEIMCEEGTYWVFDVIRGCVGEQDILEHRRQALGKLFEEELANSSKVFKIYQAKTASEKAALAEAATYSEGVIVKRIDKSYEPGVRVTHSLKIKFVKTADVVVMDRDGGGAKNAVVGVYGYDQELHIVGCCSMIGKPDAQIGEVIEVKYLYKNIGGALYQPRMVLIRDDKLASECNEGQFIVYSKGVLGV